VIQGNQEQIARYTRRWQRLIRTGLPDRVERGEHFNHFYFQAPGGQVYRLISAGEDMSKWQR
jgi:hypothetical protein